jgi:hypothetical protein
MTAKHALARLRAPDEAGVEERAWTVIRTAYPEALPAPRRRPQRRVAQTLLIGAGLAVLVLSTALASVRLFTPKSVAKHAVVEAAVATLPAAGSLLLSSGVAGTWTLAADGTTRRLGPYSQATWSPHGEYVAVVEQNLLRALTPQGRVVWSLSHPDIRDPRWYASSGWRIAYLSGSQLWVVAGDGTGDHALATGVAPVAPAWRPDHPYALAYVTLTGRGQLVIRDADSGRLLAQVTTPSPVQRLSWSADGSRLLALTRSAAILYAPDGRELARFAGAATDGALSPDGRTLALIRGANVDLIAAGARHVLTAGGLRQVAWSPDGHWLLVSWPVADEWLFVHVGGGARILAFPRIRQQFQRFPELEGWCCTARGVS